MLVQSLLLLTSIFSATSLAAPAGSKHNLYFVKCDPNDCPIGLCDPGEFTITAATYFTAPLSTSGNKVVTPDGIGKLTGYKPSFEGTSKSVRLNRAGTLTWSITATAGKSSLAGQATLGTEPFACFTDGATTFQIRDDLDRYTCKADYWCGSVDVSPTQGGDH